ncbi:ketoacyl-ACP synthase III [Porticoccaceae bacterium]|jgi:3-oxoacyl-[acyl-carrier-protein] synthase III|nr:ketoacyl-ACP synthase III [Porticoccaceae bacterium]
MLKKIRNVRINGTGSCVPNQVYTNEYLSTLVDSTPEWIYNTLGIRERRIALPEETTSDFAAKAAERAINMSGLDVGDIDLIIMATCTPDRMAPSTACIVQEKIKAFNAAAFDVNAVCSGFMYASVIAAQFVSSGMYDNVLVIGGDTFSKITDWKRRDCVFFGDGAGAAVFTHTNVDEGFLSANLKADGRGKSAWTIPAGGAENPASAKTVETGGHYFLMDGKAVFDTATKVLPKAINDVLGLSGLTIDDIKYVIPHQPSIGILKKTAEIIGADFSKFLTNMDKYANTSGGTIPILLDETNRAGMLSSGDLVLFCAVGSGWTWGASVMKWA